VTSLAANVAVAEPTMTGRVIAAWPSFSLIAAYELLMRQARYAAAVDISRWRSGRLPSSAVSLAAVVAMIRPWPAGPSVAPRAVAAT
jgi:ferric-dicitrate binding protein FerR (iron transport regulator)